MWADFLCHFTEIGNLEETAAIPQRPNFVPSAQPQQDMTQPEELKTDYAAQKDVIAPIDDFDYSKPVVPVYDEPV